MAMARRSGGLRVQVPPSPQMADPSQYWSSQVHFAAILFLIVVSRNNVKNHFLDLLLFLWLSSCLVNFVLFRGERAWVAKQLPGGLRLRAVGYAPGQSDGGAQGRGCRAAALSRG